MPLSEESNSFVQSVTALMVVGTLLGGIAGFRTIRANRGFASRAASDYTAVSKTIGSKAKGTKPTGPAAATTAPGPEPATGSAATATAAASDAHAAAAKVATPSKAEAAASSRAKAADSAPSAAASASATASKQGRPGATAEGDASDRR